MSACTFDKAWIGPCGKPAGVDGLCSEHLGKKCTSCGGQATRECDDTFQFVCGAPLCNDCRSIPGTMRHIKKSDTRALEEGVAKENLRRLELDLQRATRELEKAMEATREAQAALEEARRKDWR